MRVKLLKRAGIGFLLGITIGNLIAWVTGFSGAYTAIVSPALALRMGGEAEALAVQTIVSGFYGAATMSGTLLYEIERWPLALSFVLHYLIIAVFYVPMAFFLGWAQNAADILLVVVIQFAVSFLIWCILCAIYRKQVRELNDLRDELKPAGENEIGRKNN